MKRVLTLIAVVASVACLKAASANPTVDQKVNGAKEVLVQPIILKVADLSIADTVDPPDPLIGALIVYRAPAAVVFAKDPTLVFNPTAADLDHRRASAAVVAGDGTYASRLPWVDHPGRPLGASNTQAGVRRTVS